MNSDRLTYSNIVYLHHFNAKLQSKMKKAPSQEIDHAIVPIETIVRKISLIRGQKIMLDSDLAGELFCRYVSELTEGRFVIQQFAAGELVPGLQALDAVQSPWLSAMPWSL